MTDMYDADMYSDLYKNCYGMRPNLEAFRNATPVEQADMWDSLVAANNREMDDYYAQQERAKVTFEATVATVIASGAGDRATAIRWMVDALGPYAMGVDELEYDNGLPMGYVNRSLREAA